MVVPRPSGERALRVLVDDFPWLRATSIPVVASEFALTLRRDGTPVVLAFDQANDIRHEFAISGHEIDPERVARAAARCIHAPFN